MRSLRTATKSSPRSPQLEKACAQKRRPNAAKNKYINKCIYILKKNHTDNLSHLPCYTYPIPSWDSFLDIELQSQGAPGRLHPLSHKQGEEGTGPRVPLTLGSLTLLTPGQPTPAKAKTAPLKLS